MGLQCLHSKGETQGQKIILERINKDGFYEKTIFTGSLKNKPNGWEIIAKNV